MNHGFKKTLSKSRNEASNELFMPVKKNLVLSCSWMDSDSAIILQLPPCGFRTCLAGRPIIKALIWIRRRVYWRYFRWPFANSRYCVKEANRSLWKISAAWLFSSTLFLYPTLISFVLLKRVPNIFRVCSCSGYRFGWMKGVDVTTPVIGHAWSDKTNSGSRISVWSAKTKIGGHWQQRSAR